MASTVSRNAALSQSPDVDAAEVDGSTSVDQALALLRRAVEDTGHTLDSLQAAMGKDRAYIHRVLNGDARCTLDFIVALPDDVEARFEELRAMQFGSVVVKPASRETAASQFVAGLLGLLGDAQLPARADRMAKCYAAAKPAKAVIR
jgi:hypothetical protein